MQDSPAPRPRALRFAAYLLSFVVAAVVAAPAAQAAETLFLPYNGSGNALVFDSSTGEGAWVGAIEPTPDVGVSQPLSWTSVVLFTFNAGTGLLNGSFEFTTAADLSSTLFGTVSGSTADNNLFGNGGQFALDYTVLGGTGAFAEASGFGLAFWNFDPAGSFDNYTESGLLLIDVPTPVPEPGSWALMAGGLLLLAAAWALRRRVSAVQA